MMEAVYLGLRCAEGICLDSFETRFGVDFEAKFREVLARYQAEGFLMANDDHCALTRQGLLYADSIAAAFIASI